MPLRMSSASCQYVNQHAVKRSDCPPISRAESNTRPKIPSPINARLKISHVWAETIQFMSRIWNGLEDIKKQKHQRVSLSTKTIKRWVFCQEKEVGSVVIVDLKRPLKHVHCFQSSQSHVLGTRRRKARWFEPNRILEGRGGVGGGEFKEHP